MSGVGSPEPHGSGGGGLPAPEAGMNTALLKLFASLIALGAGAGAVVAVILLLHDTLA
jgi:hypothetical protein